MGVTGGVLVRVFVWVGDSRFRTVTRNVSVRVSGMLRNDRMDLASPAAEGAMSDVSRTPTDPDAVSPPRALPPHGRMVVELRHDARWSAGWRAALLELDKVRRS